MDATEPSASGTCPVCGGSGWKIIEQEGISGASRCDCARQKRPGIIEVCAGIPPLYREASLDNFVLPRDNDIAHRALGEVMRVVRNHVREFPFIDKLGMLFIGNPGTGKTHLAVALLRALIQKGFEGTFFDYQNLLDQIRASYDATSGVSDREAYRLAMETEILLLDDLGAHRITDWVEDIVTAIITYRCNHRKATIVTTNLVDSDAIPVTDRPSAPRDFRITLAERIGMRARSRLYEMCRIVRMPAVEDYRLRKGR